MDKRVGHGPPGRDQQKPLTERGVVDLADARVRIRSREAHFRVANARTG